MRKALGIFGLSILLTACTVINTPFHSDEIVTADNDTRGYRYLKLDNQLKVLLISDPEADKAAAALSVSVGSAQDPTDREGLAHFLEHMLFLGTDQFPESGEYQQYISTHGGSHNAYTAFEETNYFFDIDPDYFEGGLLRFSRFFVAPLFNEAYVEREKHAVHSEYMARIKNDYRRRQDAYRQIANPRHPSAKFSVGNLDTLADRKSGSVRDDLLVFYRQHYSANRMTLAVTAPAALDTLEAMVREQFAAVPNFNTRLPEQTESFVDSEKLPLQLAIRPEQELRELTVTFQLPSTRHLYRQKPLSYIGNLLGHESKGSLLSELKQRGWAEGLAAGTSMDDRVHTLFQISIGLTPEGMAHQQEILALLFADIELIREQGVEEWRYREQGALAAMQFRFQERTAPSRYVRSLATSMHDYPAVDVLRGPYRMDQFDGELIAELLAQMTPENALVMLTGPDVAVDQTTRLYQVPFGVTPLKDQVGNWSPDNLESGLALPLENPFVPTNFDLEHLTGALDRPPVLLESNDSYRLWYYQTGKGQTGKGQTGKGQTGKEQTVEEQSGKEQAGNHSLYPVPKAQVYVAVKTPVVANAEGAALTDLYLRLVEEKLNETAYEAALAGLGYGVNRRPDGFGFMVTGFDDKLSVLVETVAEAVAARSWENGDFERVRQELIRHWRNSKKDAPYQQVWREVSQQLLLESSSADELVAVLEQADKDTLKQFVPELFAGISVEILVSGNLSEQQSRELARDIQAHLPAADNPLPVLSRPVIALNSQALHTKTLQLDHPDAVVIRYYQGRDDSIDEMARMLLLRQIIKASFFNELRTEQQLGYVVAAVDVTVQRVPGIGLLVQSSAASEEEISQAVDRFVYEFKARLDTLSEEHFKQYQTGLLAILGERPKSLAEQSGRFWNSIDLRYYRFDSRQKLMNAVKLLDLAGIRQFYSDIMLSQRRVLQVKTGKVESARLTDDAFKTYQLPEK